MKSALQGNPVCLFVPLFFVILFHISPVAAQPPVEQIDSPPRSQDVASIEAITQAAFESMSAPAGTTPDTARFLTLFKPTAQLITSPKLEEGSGFGYHARSPREYVQSATAWVEQNGLFETVVHRVIEQFGHMAHVFATYEYRRHADDAEPAGRGVSSFQLLHNGKRWCIVSWFWVGERGDNPIPEKYLPQ